MRVGATMRSMQLFAREVMPALQAIAPQPMHAEAA